MCFHCSLLKLKQTIDKTRPSPLSMNKLTTEFVICFSIAKYFVIQNTYQNSRNKTKALVLSKKHVIKEIKNLKKDVGIDYIYKK